MSSSFGDISIPDKPQENLTSDMSGLLKLIDESSVAQNDISKQSVRIPENSLSDVQALLNYSSSLQKSRSADKFITKKSCLKNGKLFARRLSRPPKP